MWRRRIWVDTRHFFSRVGSKIWNKVPSACHDCFFLLPRQAPWDSETCQTSLKINGIYEASGLALWLRTGVFQVSATPSWETSPGNASMQTLSKFVESFFSKASTMKASVQRGAKKTWVTRDRLLWPVEMIVVADKSETLEKDGGFDASLNLVGCHFVLWSWYYALFLALQQGVPWLVGRELAFWYITWYSFSFLLYISFNAWTSGVVTHVVAAEIGHHFSWAWWLCVLRIQIGSTSSGRPAALLLFKAVCAWARRTYPSPGFKPVRSWKPLVMHLCRTPLWCLLYFAENLEWIKYPQEVRWSWSSTVPPTTLPCIRLWWLSLGSSTWMVRVFFISRYRSLNWFLAEMSSAMLTRSCSVLRPLPRMPPVEIALLNRLQPGLWTCCMLHSWASAQVWPKPLKSFWTETERKAPMAFGPPALSSCRRGPERAKRFLRYYTFWFLFGLTLSYKCCCERSSLASWNFQSGLRRGEILGSDFARDWVGVVWKVDPGYNFEPARMLGRILETKFWGSCEGGRERRWGCWGSRGQRGSWIGSGECQGKIQPCHWMSVGPPARFDEWAALGWFAGHQPMRRTFVQASAAIWAGREFWRKFFLGTCCAALWSCQVLWLQQQEREHEVNSPRSVLTQHLEPNAASGRADGWAGTCVEAHPERTSQICDLLSAQKLAERIADQ